jgi:site-specific DNA-cytosine methylase
MIRFVDVYTFAGGFSVGGVQAGLEMVAKREGENAFGAPAALSNRHVLGEKWQLEACEARFWTPVNAEVLLSNPPCSGFSVRSVHVPVKGIDKKNTPVSEWTNGFRGINSSINSCMHDIVEYAAKCSELQIVVFESVQQAGKLGLPLMRILRDKLEAISGHQWDLHHVFHNNISCGGNSDRPRYFWVASRIPFGVLPTPTHGSVPRAIDVLKTDISGRDGNHTPNTAEARRIKSLLETGVEWNARECVSQAAKRYVDTHGIEALRKLDSWNTARLRYFEAREFRPDQYQPRRWAANSPCPVITGKLQESVHPTAARVLTLREGARALGYPEEWSLEAYKTCAWLGKGIPVMSGKWIANSVKASIEGRLQDLNCGTLTGEREYTHDTTHDWKAWLKLTP